MLSSASLGNDPPLAHSLGQERLSDGVVDLVSAGVIEVFTLKKDACPA